MTDRPQGGKLSDNEEYLGPQSFRILHKGIISVEVFYQIPLRSRREKKNKLWDDSVIKELLHYVSGTTFKDFSRIHKTYDGKPICKFLRKACL
jgi:hypothetical protein